MKHVNQCGDVFAIEESEFFPQCIEERFCERCCFDAQECIPEYLIKRHARCSVKCREVWLHPQAGLKAMAYSLDVDLACVQQRQIQVEDNHSWWSRFS